MEEQKTKIWEVVAKCDTYEEASELKTGFLEDNPTALVKIKRGAKFFRIKMWKPEEKKKKTTKKKSKAKKG